MRDLTDEEKQTIAQAYETMNDACRKASRWHDAMLKDMDGLMVDTGFMPYLRNGLNMERFKRCEKASRIMDRAILQVMRGVV